MTNFQIKLNLNDKRVIRLALKASGYYAHPVYAKLEEPAVFLDTKDMDFIKNCLEKAINRENNWMQQQIYRETYGSVVVKFRGANAEENDLDRNRVVPNQPRETLSADRPIQ